MPCNYTGDIEYGQIFEFLEHRSGCFGHGNICITNCSKSNKFLIYLLCVYQIICNAHSPKMLCKNRCVDVWDNDLKVIQHIRGFLCSNSPMDGWPLYFHVLTKLARPTKLTKFTVVDIC